MSGKQSGERGKNKSGRASLFARRSRPYFCAPNLENWYFPTRIKSTQKLVFENNELRTNIEDGVMPMLIATTSKAFSVNKKGELKKIALLPVWCP